MTTPGAWMRSVAVQWLIRYACTLYVCLCAFSELYSAAATSFDRYVPSWERGIGWFLFLLPIELLAALILLYSHKYEKLGFRLTLLNLLLYEGFMFEQVFDGRFPVEKGDWLFMGLYTIFFATVLFSARLIPVGSRSIGKPAA
jgi:hypothetical protein